MPSVTLKKSRSLRATCERETLHNGAADDGVKGDDEKPEIGDAKAEYLSIHILFEGQFLMTVV